MVVGRFNEKLMKYPDEKLMTAYEELQILSETGYSLDATRADILEEIARRWYYSKKVDC